MIKKYWNNTDLRDKKESQLHCDPTVGFNSIFLVFNES